MVRVALSILTLAVACAPPPADPSYPQGGAAPNGYTGDPASAGTPMDSGRAVAAPATPAFDPGEFGTVDQATSDFVFDGGRIDFELRRRGDRVIQVARNRYAVPVVIAYALDELDNVRPASAPSGVIVLPAAPAPMGKAPARTIAELRIEDTSVPYRRNFTFHARFGDPAARPIPYVYRLPFGKGLAFTVLQGFHGAFSHRGSNEFAVDFNCPVATQVLAARDGLVVASNAGALGAGTTPDFLEYNRVNFVLVAHADGTLGEYMHLSPSGVLVQAGQRVARGQPLALSGNTGFSSTPHLHFQVMTAADDGVAAQPFPIRFAVGPRHAAEPVQGETYSSWEE